MHQDGSDSREECYISRTNFDQAAQKLMPASTAELVHHASRHQGLFAKNYHARSCCRAKGTGPDEALHHLRCHHRVADTATQEPQIARLAEIRQEHVPTNRLAGLLAGRCKVGAARG